MCVLGLLQACETDLVLPYDFISTPWKLSNNLLLSVFFSAEIHVRGGDEWIFYVRMGIDTLITSSTHHFTKDPIKEIPSNNNLE